MVSFSAVRPAAWRALALVAVLASCAPRARPAPAAPAAAAAVVPADVDAAARGALEHWREAYEARSVDALAKLYSHDPSLSVVQDGAQLLGWPALEPVLRDRFARATAIHVRLRDVQVTAIGSAGAVIVATMLRERSDATTAVTENGALTLVLRADDAGWVIVAEHYSYKRP
jgi:ketosteroid isomerase-like protein